MTSLAEMQSLDDISRHWETLVEQRENGEITATAMDHFATECLCQVDSIDLAPNDPQRLQRKALIRDIYTFLEHHNQA